MFKRTLIAVTPLLLLLALPIALRPAPEKSAAAENETTEKLIIITPHTEAVRYEFARAFERYYREKYHKNLEIEYRSVGGTSDIVRYIADRYEAEFRRDREKRGESWSPKLAGAFSNHRVNPARHADPEEAAVRRDFLDSEVGIGIDLFWGGGVFDHSRQGARGFGVDGKVKERHPEYFDPAIIPQRFGGDDFYDPAGRFYGVCLASFGICYNPDRLRELENPAVPDTWTALGEPRFFNRTVVADPTKSGSANKCFESILQQTMAEAVKKYGEKEGLAIGWADGMNLIKRIVANARTLTDSAGKVPRDVSSGNAAAGMAIDTYGLSEEEWSALLFDDQPKIRYIPPRGGTAVSADPVQLLRGAPNRPAAEVFIDYLLSPEGQKLWNYRVGVEGGPEKYALRRPPIRRDLYAPEYTKHFSDPDYNPYIAGESFVYHPAWTSPYFSLIRVLIKCVMLDVQKELAEAWQSIIEAGGPDAVPEAMKEFNALPFGYADAAKANDMLRTGKDRTVLDVVKTCRDWSESAREHYRRAKARAKEGK
ncbi:MAG: ABC transporter substrate-binding protein [Victivallaceae bacterium]